MFCSHIRSQSLPADSTDVQAFAQVFWAEKAAKAKLQVSMTQEHPLYQEWEAATTPILDSVPLLDAVIALQASYEARLRSQTEALCLQYGITLARYLEIKQAYYADPRLQNKLYPQILSNAPQR